MSLNIGTEACDALRALHTHEDSRPHLDKVRAGMIEQARKFMNAALDSPAVDRHTNLGYARAMRDMVVAFESAATGVQQQRVQQPGPIEGASMPLDDEGQNHIPEAVRRQGRRAEEIAREIGSIVDAPAEEPAETPVEEPVVEPVATEPAPAEPLDWEHRYRTLQGKYDAEVPAMRTRMSSLERMLAEMQHPPARPEPHAITTTVVDIPKEEVDAYGEDLIAASQRWAAAKFQPELDRLGRELAEIKGGQQRISAATTQERVIAEFDRSPPVPNWRQVNEDQKFIDWLNLVDPFSGEVRLTLLGNAFGRGDAVRCAHFFKTFIAEHTAINPASTTTPAHTPLEDAGRPTLESMAAPGRTTGTVQGGAPAEKRIWTSRDISAFYRDCADGKYAHREADKLRIESDILTAPREGRIR